MRNITGIQILVFSLSLAILGCTRQPADPTSAPAAPEAAMPAQNADLVCRPPLRRCLACNGAQFCGRACPECPAPLAPQPTEAPAPVADLVCRPPLHQCLSCNGLTRFCGRFCPECAPQAAPQPEESEPIAQLVPVGQQCGGTICAPGLHCCNPTCNLCTPKGVECTQQVCN